MVNGGGGRTRTPPSPRSVMHTVNGSYEWVIKDYSLAKGLGAGKHIASDTFTAGGHEWAIYFYPDGKDPEDSSQYISLSVALASEGTGIKALFELKLLDQSGKVPPRHKIFSHFDRSSSFKEDGPYTLKNRGSTWEVDRFYRRTALDHSDYLKDDCLKVTCTVGVVTSATEGPPRQLVAPKGASSMEIEVPSMEREGKRKEMERGEQSEELKPSKSSKTEDAEEDQRRRRIRGRQEDGYGRPYYDRNRERGREYGNRPGRFFGRVQGGGERREERHTRDDGRRYGGNDRRPGIWRPGSRSHDMPGGNRDRPRTSHGVLPEGSLPARDEGEGGDRLVSEKLSGGVDPKDGEGNGLGVNDEGADEQPVKRGRGNFTAFAPSTMVAEANARDLNPEFVPKSGFFYEHDDREAAPDRRPSFGDRRNHPGFWRRDFQSDRHNGVRLPEAIRHAPPADDRWAPGQDPEDVPSLAQKLPSKEVDSLDSQADSKMKDSGGRLEGGLESRASEQSPRRDQQKVAQITLRGSGEEANGNGDRRALSNEREGTKGKSEEFRGGRDNAERGRGFEGRRDRDNHWFNGRHERGSGGSFSREYRGPVIGRGSGRYTEGYPHRGDVRHSLDERRTGGGWRGGVVEDFGRREKSFGKKVEKWGHDLFEEVKEAPPPKKDEDDEFRAKVQALLAS